MADTQGEKREETRGRAEAREGGAPHPSHNKHEKIVAKAIPGTRVAKSTVVNGGLGLFATRRWAKGEVISKYVGEELTLAEMNERYGSESRLLRRMPDYVLLVGTTFKDASNAATANVTRYINDSRGTNARNNCKFTAAGNVVVTRPICEGREFFVAYGRAYWAEKAFLDTRDSVCPDAARASRVLYPRE